MPLMVIWLPRSLTKGATMSGNDRPESAGLFNAAMKFWIENNAMKAAEDYASRGRRLQHLTGQELQAKYTSALQQWAMTLSPSGRAEFDDCQSEYTLRGLKPPESDEIRAATNILIQKATETAKEIQTDPERHQAVNKDIVADMIADIEETRRGKLRRALGTASA